VAPLSKATPRIDLDRKIDCFLLTPPDSCGTMGDFFRPFRTPLVTPHRDDASSTARAEPGRVRRFVDDAGVAWRVFEHVPEVGRRGQPSLIFESSNVLRRVRGYPENWHELADDQLTRLSRAR